MYHAVMLEDVMTIVRSFTTPLKHVIGVNDHWTKHPMLAEFPDMVSNYERGQKMAPKDSAAYLLSLQGGEKQKIFCRMVEKTFTKRRDRWHFFLPWRTSSAR